MVKKLFATFITFFLIVGTLFFFPPTIKALDIFPFVVIATGNLNGQILPFAYGENKDEGGFTKVATAIESIRKEVESREGYSMLVDAGNSLSGSDIANYFTKRPMPGKPHPIIALMNSMKYDAAGYGISDFSLSNAVRDARKRESNFTWVGTNAYLGGNLYASDHRMLVYDVPESAHVLKVAVLSLPDPSKINAIPSDSIKGITFSDPVEEVIKASDILKEIERADFIVLLTDMEWEKDEAKKKSSSLYKLLERSRIDVCICASDDPIPGEQILFDATPEFKAHDVLVSSPGKYGLGVSRVELLLEKCKCPVKPYEVVKRADESRQITGKVVKVGRAVEISKAATTIVQPYIDFAKSQFSEVIGFANDTFTATGSAFRPTSLSNLALQVIKDTAKTQIAMIKPNELLHNLNKGPLTYGDVYSLISSDDTIYSLSISGAKIKKILEESADRLFAGHLSYAINASGLSYIIDLRAPSGSRIKDLKVAGKAINNNTNYNVGLTASLIAGPGRPQGFSGIKIQTNTRKTLRDQLVEYIRNNKNGIKPITSGSWFTVPDYLDHWAAEAISFLQEKKVISGYTDGRFLADKTISRAEYTKIVVSAYKIPEVKPENPSYTDVKKSDWFYGFIEAAKKKGMLPFADGTSFYPNNLINREEAMIELIVAFRDDSSPPKFSNEELNTFKAKFKDGDTISELGLPYLAFAFNEGFIKGYPDGTIRPKGSITRAETATIVFRAHYPTIFLASTANIQSSTNISYKDPVEDRPIGGLGMVSTYMKQFKNSYPNFLAIDAGNYLMGSSVSYLTKGSVIQEAYSEIGYSILGVSVNDLFYGIEPLKDIKTKSNISVMAADLLDKDTKKIAFDEFMLKDYSGVKVGITGVSGFSIEKPYLHKDVLDKIEILDSVKSANQAISRLRDEKASIIVLITGIEASLDLKGELSSNLATFIDGLTVKPSVVLALNGIYGFTTTYKGINIVAPGSYGNSLGTSKFIVDAITKKIEKISSENYYTYADDLNADKNILKKFEEAEKTFETELNRVIGKSNNGLTISSAGESTLGNLITDVMRGSFEGADFAFITPSVIKGNIPKDEIKVSDIYEVLPKDEDLVLLEMEGKDIVSVLEQGATFFAGMVQVSGIKFQYDNTRFFYDRVISAMTANGENVEPDKIYKVVTTESMRRGLDGYSAFSNGKVLKYSELSLRNHLFNYIEMETQRGKTIDREIEGRIILVYIG
jgi:2',3'-cyclic-nucleotide 2'-phosphodiesterase (5'-nucleotidase family)